MEKNKYLFVKKNYNTKYLKFYTAKFETNGEPRDYYFVSRRKESKLKLLTKDINAEGVVIYPVLKNEPDKFLVAVKLIQNVVQYRMERENPISITQPALIFLLFTYHNTSFNGTLRSTNHLPMTFPLKLVERSKYK